VLRAEIKSARHAAPAPGRPLMMQRIMQSSAMHRPAVGCESRLFDPQETLHAPHLLDIEVAQVIRRYAATGEMDTERGGAALDEFAAFPLRRYALGSLGATSRL
jgi:predicted nucleic acid-binding protein